MRTIIAIAAALAITPAFAAMSLVEGQEYAEARTMILADGWEPVASPGQNRVEECGSREPCEAYPETVSCSGTGEGFCAFEFAKGGRTLNVVTRGDEPTLAHWSID